MVGTKVILFVYIQAWFCFLFLPMNHQKEDLLGQGIVKLSTMIQRNKSLYRSLWNNRKKIKKSKKNIGTFHPVPNHLMRSRYVYLAQPFWTKSIYLNSRTCGRVNVSLQTIYNTAKRLNLQGTTLHPFEEKFWVTGIIMGSALFL